MQRHLLLAATAVIAASCASGLDSKITRIAADFEDEPPFSLPPELQATDPGGDTAAHWYIAADTGAGASRRSLRVDGAESTGRQFHLVLTDAPFATGDLWLSVQLLAEGGEEDQGGGLVWRARGDGDYYVARWNPLEDNVRIYRVMAGDRQMLQSADVEVATDEWHELAVAVQGRHMTVLFDGKTLYTVQDSTFSGRGLVGLWTKADARTAFDDWHVRWLGQNR